MGSQVHPKDHGIWGGTCFTTGSQFIARVQGTFLAIRVLLRGEETAKGVCSRALTTRQEFLCLCGSFLALPLRHPLAVASCLSWRTLGLCDLTHHSNTKGKSKPISSHRRLVLFQIGTVYPRLQALRSINHRIMGRWGMCESLPPPDKPIPCDASAHSLCPGLF